MQRRAALTVVVAIALWITVAGATSARIQVALNGHRLDAAALVFRGHVYLPLRALFTAMGAHLRYEASTHNVQAVRGANKISIVAPLMEHGLAYVPVRVVAQEFGARVAYNARERTVFIADNLPSQVVYHAPAARPFIVNVTPQNGALLPSGYTTVSATIVTRGSRVDLPNVHLLVDGTDVSALCAFDGRTISYTPNSALSVGMHAVQLQGVDSAGQAFSSTWSFAVTASPTPSPQSVGFSFYIPGSQDSFSRGNPMEFLLIAPPGGTAYLTLCGLGIFPMNGGAYSTHYVTTMAMPSLSRDLWCTPVAHYTSAFGAKTTLQLIRPILLRAPTPAPTSSPKPSPTPTTRPAPRKRLPSPEPRRTEPP